MQVIYFPDFEGGSHSNTYQIIQNHYPDAQVINYESSDLLAAFVQIKMQLFGASPDNTLLVGERFGGFWAEFFAFEQKFPVILINPALEPLHMDSNTVAPSEPMDVSSSILQKTGFFSRGKVEKNISIFLSTNHETLSSVYTKYGEDFPYIHIPEGEPTFDFPARLLQEIRTMQAIRMNS